MPHRRSHVGGIPFLRGAVGELRDRTPGIMTLISLAILVAFRGVSTCRGRPGRRDERLEVRRRTQRK